MGRGTHLKNVEFVGLHGKSRGAKVEPEPAQPCPRHQDARPVPRPGRPLGAAAGAAGAAAARGGAEKASGQGAHEGRIRRLPRCLTLGAPLAHLPEGGHPKEQGKW